VSQVAVILQIYVKGIDYIIFQSRIHDDLGNLALVSELESTSHQAIVRLYFKLRVYTAIRTAVF
jgi:hypothetical protein